MTAISTDTADRARAIVAAEQALYELTNALRALPHDVQIDFCGRMLTWLATHGVTTNGQAKN